MGVDELMNPAVRGRSAHYRQDTKQPQVREIVPLPLRTTVIRNRQQALFYGDNDLLPRQIKTFYPNS